MLDVSADGNWTVSIDTPSITTTTTSPTTTSTTKPSTTSSTSDDDCLSESIYGEQSEETELLRYIRDEVLSQTPEGQEIISLYYEWSPVIVEIMKEDEEFKKEIREIIDEILVLVRE